MVESEGITYEEVNNLEVKKALVWIKKNIPEIKDWIQDLNQSAMFGIFRRDFLSKARTLLGMIANKNIPEIR